MMFGLLIAAITIDFQVGKLLMRGIMMVVDIDDYSKLPHITEPLMMTFDASVNYQIAIHPDELMKADLEQYAE